MNPIGRWLRDRALARQREAFAPEDWERAWDALPLLDGLDDAEAGRLAELALLFLDAKTLEPVQGLELDPAMRLVIALQACLPVLELGLDWYSGWYAVVVYPDQFLTAHRRVDEAGVVWDEPEVRSGESWEQGPVILSWADIEAGFEADGYNVVIHELAHKLDMRDGAPNGRPPLHAGMSGESWSRAWSRAYEDHCRRVDAGEDTPIDPYGAEAPAEFFAVVSESFFELPDLLDAEYPEVYAQLRDFYRQDPLARLRRLAGGGDAFDA